MRSSPAPGKRSTRLPPHNNTPAAAPRRARPLSFSLQINTFDIPCKELSKWIQGFGRGHRNRSPDRDAMIWDISVDIERSENRLNPCANRFKHRANRLNLRANGLNRLENRLNVRAPRGGRAQNRLNRSEKPLNLSTLDGFPVQNTLNHSAMRLKMFAVHIKMFAVHIDPRANPEKQSACSTKKPAQARTGAAMTIFDAAMRLARMATGVAGAPQQRT
jgi:hypothetical protein